MLEQLKTVTLASLVKQGKITSINKQLKQNTSGYYYVTMLQGNKANNLYFGKKTGVFLENHFSVGDNVLPLLKNCNVVQTKNDAGEVRFKISTSENSNYTSQSELMEIFGSEEVVSDFSMELFDAEFKAKPEVLIPTEA